MTWNLFHAIKSHMRLRFNEWVSSVTLAAWGVGFLVNEKLSLSLSYFARLESFKSLVTLGIVCLALGLSRIVLLFINGAWGLSPHFRAIGSAISACTWTLMWTYFFNPNYIIPSLATIGTLVILDLYSLWYAAEDARYSDVRRRKLHDRFEKD